MPNDLRIHLTLVTHYGKKPHNIENLIMMLQGKLSESLGFAFKPYDMEQVHGTIIGLEGIITDKGIVNQWFHELKKENRIVDLSRLLQYLRADKLRDIEIKIGGWQLHEDYNFESRSKHPFARSFSIQGEIVVAMGWPFQDNEYSERLYELRKSFEEFNILHKWNKDGYKDNDFFFVLGRVSKKYINPLVLQRTSSEIRTILSGIDERVKIGKDTMSVVAYIDPQLPTTTSNAFSMEESELTPETLERLYKQSITIGSS